MPATRSATLRLRRSLHSSRIGQIILIALFWAAGEAVAHLTGLPVPGGAIGMLFVLALLASGRLSLLSMRRGAQWFLAEMLLFFIPAVLAVLDHREFLGILGLKILAVIVIGTVSVMCATALAVDLGFRIVAHREARHAHVD